MGTTVAFKKVFPYAKDAMNLPVRDVNAAIPFYESIMGFQLVSRQETPMKSAVLQRDDIRIGLAENGGDPEQEGCFFEVDDDEAVMLMNDSPYGLTASIWTRDMDRAAEIGARIKTGTVYMNRCDYLDPHLTWTGVKDTGRGAALSKYGFDALTQPKSFHLRDV